MNTLEFSRELIKGKIAETVFEQMLRESGEFTVLRFGYEYTLPEIAQFQHLAEIQAVLKNIRNAPDFVLVSKDKTKVYLVEVKFCTKRIPRKILETANEILKTWNPAHLFIASPDGFFFSPCSYIIKGSGNISPMLEKWVSKESQAKYLKLLDEFEK